jgi:LPS-assembly lipoprotein
MWSRNSTISKAWNGLAVLVLAGALGGCFQPMYGESTLFGAGAKLRDDLRQVEILEIPGNRLGQEIRNDLIFELNGGQPNPVGAPYKLAITITAGSQTPLVDVASGRATSETVTLDVVYRMLDVSNDRVVLSEKAIARISIDRSAQRYAGMRAVRDAQNRAAKLVAEQIRSRLASYFLTRT